MLRDSKFQRVLIAGVLIIIALALYQVDVRLHITDAFSLSISDLLMIAAAVAAGYPIAVNAFQAIRFRIVGIDALVTLAVVGAILIREYWEAAAVTFLFMLGDYLESRALEKTRSAIRSLLELAPDTARVLRNGEEVELAPEEVETGDLVIVRPRGKNTGGRHGYRRQCLRQSSSYYRRVHAGQQRNRRHRVLWNRYRIRLLKDSG